MHVEDRVDVEPRQEVHRRAQVGDVAVEDRLAELVRVARLAPVADSRVVGRGPSWLEPAPGHAQSDDVEGQPGHERRVGGGKIPWAPGVGVELVGRELVDGVHTMEEHHSTVAVVEIRATRRTQGTRNGCGLDVCPVKGPRAQGGQARGVGRRGGHGGRHQDGGGQDESGRQGQTRAAIHGDQSGVGAPFPGRGLGINWPRVGSSRPAD
jgi:hypothetical protein